MSATGDFSLWIDNPAIILHANLNNTKSRPSRRRLKHTTTEFTTQTDMTIRFRARVRLRSWHGLRQIPTLDIQTLPTGHQCIQNSILSTDHDRKLHREPKTLNLEVLKSPNSLLAPIRESTRAVRSDGVVLPSGSTSRSISTS